jgi:mannose-1-phosphate guanylyltransferase
VILLGISPDTPEADYRWIQPGAPLGGSSIFRVERFWEKRCQSLASTLLSRGCLWNSFIMVGRAQAFPNLIQRALTALLQSFCAMTSGLALADQMALDDLYSQTPTVNFPSRYYQRARRRWECCAPTVWSGATWETPVEFSRFSHAKAPEGVEPSTRLQGAM